MRSVATESDLSPKNHGEGDSADKQPVRRETLVGDGVEVGLKYSPFKVVVTQLALWGGMGY